MGLKHGQVLEHVTLKNRDNTPLRCRVNGKVKTWVTKPNDWRLPVKFGLKTYFYINDSNGFEWTA